MFPSFNARALGWSVPTLDAIELAAAAGFVGIDLMVRDLMKADLDPHWLRARMARRGLRGGAWPLPVRWRADETTYRADLVRLPEQAAVAAALGLTRTGTWVLPETATRPQRDDLGSMDAHLARVTRFHQERLGAIARILDDQGIRLGLEVLGVATSRPGVGLPYVTRLADLDRWLGPLLEEYPNVGILIDAFHLYAANEDVQAGLAWGARRVIWVHVADLPRGASGDRRQLRDDVRGLPGETGRVDVKSVLQALANAGYQGPVTVETLVPRPILGAPSVSAARTVAESLRRVWPVS